LKGDFEMSTTITDTEHDRFGADLRARLWTERWTARDEQLDALAGVLPQAAGMPEASVLTDKEAAFVLGGTLLVASWDENDAHLTTHLLSLAGTPLTIEWNADWLSAYDPDDSDVVPDDRPMTVTVSAPSGEVYVLPFHDAWHNPVGCINFASRLIEKAHGFLPGVGTARQTYERKTWKR
jgi:hypothetical protein